MPCEKQDTQIDVCAVPCTEPLVCGRYELPYSPITDERSELRKAQDLAQSSGAGKAELGVHPAYGSPCSSKACVVCLMKP